jgi:hypothetical protein
MGVGTSRCSPAFTFDSHSSIVCSYYRLSFIDVIILLTITPTFRAISLGGYKVIVDMHCTNIRLFCMHRYGCESGYSFGLDVEVGPASYIPDSYTRFRIVSISISPTTTFPSLRSIHVKKILVQPRRRFPLR